VSVGSGAFNGPKIRIFNFVGKKPSGNEIERVCDLLSGKGQSGDITTFKFSLSAEVSKECEDLVTYINDVLALDRPDLLSSITSGTLDLCGAGVEIGSLSEPGTLIDTIKQGEQLYKWNDSQWEEWSEVVE
jgi:hypothetical protein